MNIKDVEHIKINIREDSFISVRDLLFLDNYIVHYVLFKETGCIISAFYSGST